LGCFRCAPGSSWLYDYPYTYAPSREKRFGKQAKSLRKEAQKDFRKTARLINLCEAAIGTEADYDEECR